MEAYEIRGSRAGPEQGGGVLGEELHGSLLPVSLVFVGIHMAKKILKFNKI